MDATLLLADIHGHALTAAKDDENYLTSAVFGHLRYIRPKYFWQRLFSFARGLPEAPTRQSLADFISRGGDSVSEYEFLNVFFWPRHLRYGEPDLLFSFTGYGLRPVVLIVEVKLQSGKSGDAEDQLVRYLRSLDELEGFSGLNLPHDSLRALLYLTPRESLAEIRDSLKSSPDPCRDQNRIFRLQWQDFIPACDGSLPTGQPQIDMILRNVRQFLSSRQLEYFAGFLQVATPPGLQAREAAFSTFLFRLDPPPELEVKKARFSRLFGQLDIPELFVLRRAPWVRET